MTISLLVKIAIALSCLLLWYTHYSNKNKNLKFFGKIFFILGFIAGLIQFYNSNPTKIQNKNKIPSSIESDKNQKQVLILPLPDSRIEPARIDLSVTGVNLQNKIIGEYSKWWILDASKGIREEYSDWIKKHFATFNLLTQEESVQICWRRTSSYPIATGKCMERKTRYVLDASPGDLSRTTDGKATVSLTHIGNTNVILIVHSLPQNDSTQNWMKEEICLDALSKGQGCGLVDILPGTSLYALSILSHDPEANKTLEDFNLAHDSLISKALTEFGEKASPLPLHREFLKNANWCPGVFENSQLQIAELSWLTKELELLTTHANLLRAVHHFTDHAVCSGLYSFTLPKLQMQDPRSGLRTVLQSLREEPVWLTTPTSFAYRNQHIKNTSLNFDTESNHNVAWVKTTDPIEQLSVSFVMPENFSEELLMEISAGGAEGTWRVNSLGANSFRVVFNQVIDSSWIDLKDFIRILQKPHLKFSTFTKVSGVPMALVVAYLLAGFIAFVQLSSPSGTVQKYWWFSFAIVFFITFILTFVSYFSARALAGGNASVTSIEGPNAPPHFFLQEWPVEWFDSLPQTLQENKVPELVQNEKENLTFVREPINTQIKRPENPRAVVVWDDKRARNYYFRRSPSYEAAILGWKALAKAENPKWSFIESSEIQSKNLQVGGILIVPDLAFISDADLLVIETFVSNGGTLLFAAGLSDDAGKIDYTHFKGPFSETLKDVGMGTIQFSQYSEIKEPGFSVNAITSLHLITENTWIKGKKYHSGSVVFLGIQPLDSKSQALDATIIHRLQGEQLLVRELGAGCSSALLVKNFASKERIEKFFDEAKAEGLEVRWFIDPNAFPNLEPKLRDRFIKDGVAFVDDNTGSGRFAAERNWSNFLKQNNLSPRPLLLVSERNQPKGQYNGPYVEMIQGVPLDINPVLQEKSLRNWQAECAMGIARPRIISEARSTELNSLITNLKSHQIKRTGIIGLNEYQKRHGLAEENGPSRNLKYRVDLPTLFEK